MRVFLNSMFSKHTGFLCLFFCILAFSINSSSVSAGIVIKDTSGKQVGLYQESHALVIGVSEYTDWPILPGVKKDVQLVKAALEAQGFEVETVMDPDRKELQNAYRHFIDRYGHNPDNRLLFYYAGHGHTLKLAYGGDMGYIVPKDAPNPNRDKNGFLRKALDMEQMEVFAKRIESKHALFLFDSCFSGSIFALSRAVPENISYKTSKPVRQFITAGSANETVPDESIFRHQFISALEGEGDLDKDGYVTGVELGEFLQKKVVNYSQGSQHPQYGKIRNPHLDKGDFVFSIESAKLDLTAPNTKKNPSFAPPTSQPKTSVQLDRKGDLQISVNVHNVRVSINGKEYGNMEPYFPEKYLGLPSGNLTLKVESKGFETIEKQITIRGNEWTKENLKLKFKKEPPLDPIYYQGLDTVELITQSSEFGDRMQFSTAIALARRAVATDRNNHGAWWTLGVNYFWAGMYKEALDALNKTVQLNPEFLYSYWFLGMAHFALNNFKKAEETFKTKLEIDDGDDAGAYFSLFQIYAESGQKEKAKRMHEILTSRFPEYLENKKRFFNFIYSAYLN